MTAAPLLGELKGLRVLVLHPLDSEARLVIGQLRRIGCEVEQAWPVPALLPGAADVVLLSIELDQRAAIASLVAGLDEQAPPLIAIVGYESPSMLELVLSAQPAAVIERPLKPFGLLTQLIMARAAWRRRVELLAQIRKLEVRQSAVGRVAMAKMLLIARHGISEGEAHKRIQRQAMAQRCAMEVVARAIIEHAASPRSPP
ncbi:ANTAR domain-containing protein [Pseudomonas sp. NPDC007930]|uniref:ANTAR domain-containing response regulator n=1 Tax=Pseudomonas sp. NPDC007930 TaxID=3364417 RepID=UPI0036EE3AC3